MAYSQDLKTAYRSSLILYTVIMATLAIYLGVFEILKAHIPNFQGAMDRTGFPWLRYAFYALGLIQVFLIKFINEAAVKSIDTTDIQTLIQYLQRMAVISATLCEVPVLLGWVLFFLGGLSRDFYILLILSFVLFVIYFPRYPHWEMRIRSKVIPK